jgi:hypothetical protein
MLPKCISFENGKHYFYGKIKNESVQLLALETKEGWVASYRNVWYLIDNTNCTLLIGENTKIETGSFTTECNDCEQNKQPRVVEKSERIIYGGFKNQAPPEMYEDCEDC